MTPVGAPSHGTEADARRYKVGGADDALCVALSNNLDTRRGVIDAISARDAFAGRLAHVRLRAGALFGAAGGIPA